MAFDLANAGAGLLHTATLIGIVLLVGILVILVVWQWLSRKKFDYRCFIVESVGGLNVVVGEDKAGIFVDNKTGNKRFFLQKGNVGLTPDKVPWIPSVHGSKVVFLLKVGLKNYRFIDMKFATQGQFTITVGEEDVNWGINAYERAKKLFASTLLQQILPYIGVLIMGIVIVIMLVVIVNKFEVLKELAAQLQKVAETIVQARTGTTVLPGA